MFDTCCKTMFQWFQLFQSYVAVSVFMLQVFYLNVIYVFTHMFQVYVPNISSASDVCCIQVFHVLEVCSESYGARRTRQARCPRMGRTGG